MVTDAVLPTIFIVSYVILEGWQAFGVYAVAFVLIAAMLYRNDISNMLKMAKKENKANGQQSVEEE